MTKRSHFERKQQIPPQNQQMFLKDHLYKNISICERNPTLSQNQLVSNIIAVPYGNMVIHVSDTQHIMVFCLHILLQHKSEKPGPLISSKGKHEFHNPLMLRYTDYSVLRVMFSDFQPLKLLHKLSYQDKNIFGVLHVLNKNFLLKTVRNIARYT